jgi:hypothetical protein
MTNLESIPIAMERNFHKLPEDKLFFFGFDDFNRTNDFWIRLNRLFKRRPSTGLYLYSYGRDADLSFLNLMPDVERLKVSGINTLTPIQKLSKLKNLSILDNRKSILFDFQKTPKIENLWTNTKLRKSTLKSLQSLVYLKDIEISGAVDFKLEYLLEAKSLESEYILNQCEFNEQVFNTFFSNAVELKSIYFKNLRNVKFQECFQFFSKAPKLQELRLKIKENCFFDEQEPLKKLTLLALDLPQINTLNWVKEQPLLETLYLANINGLQLKDFENLIHQANKLKKLAIEQNLKKSVKDELKELFTNSEIELVV